MNKRIRELADEATSIVEMVGPQGYASSYANFDREKFAQLIVRECVGVCEEYHGTAGDQAAQYIGQGIKEHFGVKQ